MNHEIAFVYKLLVNWAKLTQIEVENETENRSLTVQKEYKSRLALVKVFVNSEKCCKREKHIFRSSFFPSALDQFMSF